MESQKKISIVVPVYNRAGIVGRTLDSIFSQEGIENAEVILVDNNSSDKSLDVLNDYAEKARANGIDVKVAVETLVGAANARNRGLSMASAPMVMFFDSDDTLNEGSLARILATIAENPHAELILWNVMYLLPQGKSRATGHSDKHLLWQHLVHGICSTLRMAVSRQLLQEIGGWNGTLLQWDDLEIGTRILLKEPVTASVESPTPLAAVNFTPKSITGCNYSSTAGRWEKALDAIARELENDGHTSLWVDMRRAMLAADYFREGRKDLAENLKRMSLEGKPRSRRALWRMAYTKHRLYERGTCRLFAIFLGKKI